jgi:hypothetical protein
MQRAVPSNALAHRPMLFSWMCGYGGWEMALMRRVRSGPSARRRSICITGCCEQRIIDRIHQMRATLLIKPILSEPLRAAVERYGAPSTHRRRLV